MINERNHLFRLTKKYPHSLIIKESFIKIRNKIANLSKIKKKQYYSNLINENYNNPRKFWKIINEALYNRINNNEEIILPKLINLNGNSINNKREILNFLNNFFVTAAYNNFSFDDNHYLYTNLYLPQLFSESDFQFNQISLETLRQSFKTMNKNASAGIDLI